MHSRQPFTWYSVQSRYRGIGGGFVGALAVTALLVLGLAGDLIATPADVSSHHDAVDEGHVRTDWAARMSPEYQLLQPIISRYLTSLEARR
jgi:hypothetical protein